MSRNVKHLASGETFICLFDVNVVLNYIIFRYIVFLMGHFHGDSQVWSKSLKILTKNLCHNMKLLLENREENIKRFLQGRTN